MAMRPFPIHQSTAPQRAARAAVARPASPSAAGVAYVLIARPEAVEAPIVGQFSLTDDEGQAVTEATYAGSYMLVYFGYTFCPDICPTELTKMTTALEQFEAKSPERAAKVVPIFISVDPERDTQAALKDYTDYFHARLVALTGTPGAAAQGRQGLQGLFRQGLCGRARPRAQRIPDRPQLADLPDGPGRALPDAIHRGQFGRGHRRRARPLGAVIAPAGGQPPSARSNISSVWTSSTRPAPTAPTAARAGTAPRATRSPRSARRATAAAAGGRRAACGSVMRTNIGRSMACHFAKRALV